MFFVRWAPVPGRSQTCGSWLACDAGDAVFMGKPRRYHRWQASSHRGMAGGFLEGGRGCFLCGGHPYRADHRPVGAGLPTMQATRFLWVNRVDIIAGKPAPTEGWPGDFWRVVGGGFCAEGPVPGRSQTCGSWLACDAGDAVFMGEPRRYHRWQASSHRGMAGGHISASNITVTRPLY